MQVNVHLSDKSYVFTVVLMSRMKYLDTNKSPDCKISSFGANLWFRKNHGLNGRRYSNTNNLSGGISSKIRKCVETEGKVTFSLSNKVFTI